MNKKSNNVNPKAYELAKELGVTARQLLLRAAELDLKLQNRLTRVDPKSAELLRQAFANDSED